MLKSSGFLGFVNYYVHPTFASDAAYAQYIATLCRNALLTLATCLGDDRLIIVARRVEDEAAKL